MTDSNRSMSEVPALIEERRRYEGWLAALSARRETTPKHVFERVQADYRARLQRVADALASHRQGIEEERATLQSRLSVLEAEERLQRDERAELELRAHVGELFGDDAATAFKTVDDKIAQMTGEKDALSARVGELQALLDEGAPTPAAEPPAREPETQAAVSEAIHAAASAARAEVAVRVAAAAEPAPSPAPVRGAPARPAAVPPVAPPAARPRGESASFDELAFLSSVVGKEQQKAAAAASAAPVHAPAPHPPAAPVSAAPPAVPEAPEAAAPAAAPLIERRSSEPLLRPSENLERDEPVAESLLAGLDNKRAPGERPLAANIAANTPIVLRPAGTIEQSKTLKCTECGAMNYPTEWYCERCGAELAAL